jgi:hypothetical protein
MIFQVHAASSPKERHTSRGWNLNSEPVYWSCPRETIERAKRYSRPRIVVQYAHCEPLAVAGLRVFQLAVGCTA